VLSVDKGANGGSQDLVSSPFKGDSIYLSVVCNVEAARSYLDYIGCVGRQHSLDLGDTTNLLDQTNDQLWFGGNA
jgi:hypothetical protein